jgi:hypothetical protein
MHCGDSSGEHPVRVSATAPSPLLQHATPGAPTVQPSASDVVSGVRQAFPTQNAPPSLTPTHSPVLHGVSSPGTQQPPAGAHTLFPQVTVPVGHSHRTASPGAATHTVDPGHGAPHGPASGMSDEEEVPISDDEAREDEGAADEPDAELDGNALLPGAALDEDGRGPLLDNAEEEPSWDDGAPLVADAVPASLGAVPGSRQVWSWHTYPFTQSVWLSHLKPRFPHAATWNTTRASSVRKGESCSMPPGIPRFRPPHQDHPAPRNAVPPPALRR